MEGGREGGREKCVGEREEKGEREEADFMGPLLHSTADRRATNATRPPPPTDACFGKV